MPEDRVAITTKEWQDLHSREFQNAILDRVWSRIAWMFGAGSLLALISAGLAIWGPIKGQIIAEVIKEVRSDITALRVELTSRITGDTAASLRSAAQEIAKAEAERQIRDSLRDPASPLRQQLVAAMQAQLREGLARQAMAGEARNDFLEGALDQRALSFRLLRSLDAGAAHEALALLLQRRLAMAAEPGPLDAVLADAVRAMLPRAGVTPEQPVTFNSLRDLATLLVANVERSRTPGDPLSDGLTNAAGAWLGSLGPPATVADWLVSRSLAARALPGRYSVIWELLLRDERPEALMRLGTLFGQAPPAEVDGALRLLSGIRWPSLDAVPAERLLAVIEPHVPDAALGHAGLTAALLEARFAVVQAAARGPGAVRFAWARWGEALRNAPQAEWRVPVAAYERVRSRGAEISEQAAGRLASLPLASFDDANRHWPGLLARLLAAVPADQAEAFAGLLLRPLPPNAPPDLVARRDRRLGILALALVREGMTVEMPAAIPAALLAGLAGDPRLASSRELGVALQRVAAVAEPAACTAALPRLAVKAAWPAAALLACAARAPGATSEAAARRIAEAEPRDRATLLRLWALAGLRAADFAWPQADDEAATATLLLGLLREAGSPRPSAAMLALLAAMRPALRAPLDAALERDGRLLLFPAPADSAADALPEWADPAWWAAGGGPRPVGPAPGQPSITHAVPKDMPWRVSVACAPGLATRFRLSGGGDAARHSLLVVGEGRPAMLAEGMATRNLLVGEAGCAGERLVRIRAAEGAELRVTQEPPPRAAAFATSFEDRARATPLQPGQPVSVRLGRDEAAVFPLTLDPARRYAIRTRNLAPEVDTVLSLLDRNGQALREDDDAGEEPNASVIWTQLLDAPETVALRATTFGGSGGAFEILVEDVGAAAAVLPLRLGEPLATRLDGNESATFALTLRAGQRYRITTSGLADGVDTLLTLLAPDRALLGEDDDGGGNLASRLEVTPTTDGVHTLGVRNISRQAGGFTLLAEEQ